MCPFTVSSFFNSHPHKEDDTADFTPELGNYFSTHILTRRMTSALALAQLQSAFSTHILTRRMTEHPKDWHEVITFQLTSSQGG